MYIKGPNPLQKFAHAQTYIHVQCNMHALWPTPEGKDLSLAIVQLIEFKLGSQLVHVNEQEVRISGYRGDVLCKFNF